MSTVFFMYYYLFIYLFLRILNCKNLVPHGIFGGSDTEDITQRREDMNFIFEW